jgi:RNA polymerase-binding protein DksA
VALTQTQIAELKKELDRLHQMLLEEVRDELEASDNEKITELLGRTPPDSGDFSFADALADLNVAMVDRHIHQLRDIEATRQRIGVGGFGLCDDCGTEVDFDRLMAYPTAKRCVRCQQQRERLYAHQSTPKL